MKHRFGRRTPAIIALKVAVRIALGAVLVGLVMLLWNWLLPALFAGVRTIDYWQTLGLIVLCRVLFGGGHGRWGRRRRWHKMRDDERAQFKENYKGRRCGRSADAQGAAEQPQ